MYKNMKRTKGYRLFLNCLLSSIQLGINRSTYQKDLKFVYGEFVPPIKEIIEDFRTVEIKFPRQMGKTHCLVDTFNRDSICTDNKVAMLYSSGDFLYSGDREAIENNKNCFDFNRIKADELIEIINNNRVVIVNEISRTNLMVFIKESIDNIDHILDIDVFNHNKLPLFVVIK